MVDASSRRIAEVLVRKYRAGELTNFQFADGWPRSSDVAVEAIRSVLWSSWDDLREHRYEASPECDDVFARCAEFLETDEEYVWPVPNRLLLLLWTPFSFVTFGLLNRIVWRKYDFPAHWPFAVPRLG